MGDEDSNEDLVDAYLCYHEHQLSRVLQLLDEADIAYLVRDHASVAFPTTVGTTSESVVAVHPRDRAQVHEIIRGAVADEVISADGELVES